MITLVIIIFSSFSRIQATVSAATETRWYGNATRVFYSGDVLCVCVAWQQRCTAVPAATDLVSAFGSDHNRGSFHVFISFFEPLRGVETGYSGPSCCWAVWCAYWALPCVRRPTGVLDLYA